MTTAASEIDAADPMPVATLGMYFFLASEAMFFVGLLGSFVVLESAGDQHQVFVASSKMLSSWIALSCALLLILSSPAIVLKKAAALPLALAFLLLQALQWKLLLPTNGPWVNNFFGCYFLMSGVHSLHLLAGIVAVIVMRKFSASVQIYWHFMNAIGIASLFVLYFV